MTRVFVVVYTVLILLGNIETKTRGIKILKFPIRYCGMNFKEGWINRNLTKNINYTQTDNSVLVICNDYNHKNRGSTLHSKLVPNG